MTWWLVLSHLLAFGVGMSFATYLILTAEDDPSDDSVGGAGRGLHVPPTGPSGTDPHPSAGSVDLPGGPSNHQEES